MKKSKTFLFSAFLIVLLPVLVVANSIPVVSNVIAGQRTDGSKLVDIYYDLADADGNNCAVWVEVSGDGGSTWDVNAVSLTGDIGAGITPDTGKHIIWDCGADLPGVFGSNYRVRVYADDGVCVDINDPGVDDTGDGIPDHEGFNGYMSKYETTNAQYCQFLNAAFASGDITVDADSGNIVFGANGSNLGADFVGEVYCHLSGSGRINWTGSSFTVDSGFENHPVTYVSWYGATAFCNYYGYRLPTEWEWQAVADYDGSYTYGCGTDINTSLANYLDSNHPDGTTAVGAFGTYGYGMADMAGNVWEWTSTVDGFDRVIRGGSWTHVGNYCAVSSRETNYGPRLTSYYIGFRVCRDTNIVGVDSGLFIICNYVIFLLDPNGGEILTAGNTHTIRWSSTGIFNNCLIEYSTDNGSNWTTIDTVPNTGSYDWLVPAVNSNQCFVRISEPNNPAISDTSDDVFTIRNLSLWEIEIVDSNGDVGQYSSIKVDSLSRAHISYYDSSNGNLKYAKKDGLLWSVDVVDDVCDVGLGCSIALDSNDAPHISYVDVTSCHIKYAVWKDSVWDIEDISNWSDSPTSLALDYRDGPHIGYCGYGKNGDVRYTYKDFNAFPPTWKSGFLDFFGRHHPLSLRLDCNDCPHVSYCYGYPLGDADLKYAVWNNNSWYKETVDNIGNVGEFSSLALDSRGCPHISYYNSTNGNLKYAVWTGIDWHIETVDGNDGDVGQYTSIALDNYNHPHISYYDATNGDLKYAVLSGNGWSIFTIDSDGDVGKYSSLYLDIYDRAHISYYDVTNGNLKYANTLSIHNITGNTFHTTIQNAIDFAVDGDIIVVGPGTYTGNGNRDIDFEGKAITVRSTDPNDPCIVGSTIIDCQGTEDDPHRGFYLHSGEDTNSVLFGLTITNGYAERGGAMFCYEGSPTITKCIIINNTATGTGGTNEYEGGGGISCEYSAPLIANCTFIENKVISYEGYGGGGICRGGGIIENCIFYKNSAPQGGAISQWGGNIINCIIRSNYAFRTGGGLDGCNSIIDSIICENSAGMGGGIFVTNYVKNCIIRRNRAVIGGGTCYHVNHVTNCLIVGNIATLDGGGAAMTDGLINCTIIGNIALGYAGGVLEGGYWDGIKNCIIWSNISVANGSQVYDSVVPTNSCIQDWIGGGDGNIDSYPYFVDIGSWDTNGTPSDINDDVWVDGNYRLEFDSPCIDAGDPIYVGGPNGTDLDGNPRIVGNRIDMGAYEFQSSELRYADLTVTSEDLTFKPLPGKLGQDVNISANICNIGISTANNIKVIFKDYDKVIREITIPSINSGDCNIVTIQYTWNESSFRLITVEIDPNNTIPELDDETNNSASKVYQVGDMSGMGVSVEVSCSAPTGFPQGSTGSISGQANYRIETYGQEDYIYPVKGGAVTAKVYKGEIEQQEVNTYTDKQGQFRIYFYVPGSVGETFDVNITVTDGTFTGNWQKTFNVIEWRDFRVSNIVFSDSNPEVDQTITISATVYADNDNTYAHSAIPVTFWEYPPSGGKYQIGYTQYTGQLQPGASETVHIDANFPEQGQYYIQASLEPGFSDDKSYNNTTGLYLQVGHPMLMVTASPRYNVHKGEIVHITVTSREPLPSDQLDSITVKDHANQDIPFVPSEPCHPSVTQWLYETEPLPEGTATGTATITVTGTASDLNTYTASGYFEITDEPVLFDLWIHSEDISLTDNNPDLGETITIAAVVHARSSNTRTEPNTPVTFYADHAGDKYKIGSTQYTGEIQPGSDWSVSTSWTNAAEGGYIIEAILGPGFSDDYSSNNEATRAVVVGDYSLLAYLEVSAKERIDRTVFRYTCKVKLFNNSDAGIEDVYLELLQVPDNITVHDSAVTYNSVGAWGAVTSNDTCVFDVNRSEAIPSEEIIWKATYKIAGTSEIEQQIFSNIGPVKLDGPAGDVTGDGEVNSEDLYIMARDWLKDSSIADIFPPPDGDNIVDFKDFDVLADNWLKE